MARKEDVVKNAVRLMNNTANIRNIGIAAHIDHGKCISGNSRILLGEGSTINAKSLYGKIALSGTKIRETGNETVFEPKETTEIFSVNKENGKIEKKRISHAWKLKGGRMLKIRLRNGYSISTTPEHKYLIFDGASFGFKEAQNLQKGETVVAARKLNCEIDWQPEKMALKLMARDKFYIKLKAEHAQILKEKIIGYGLKKAHKEISTDLKLKSFYHSTWKGTYRIADLIKLANLFGLDEEHIAEWIYSFRLKDSDPVKWPKNWKNVFYLAGLMIGDGTGNKFVAGKSELAEKFIEICNSLGVSPKIRNYSGKTIEYSTNKTIHMFLNTLFDYPLKKKSHNVKISAFVNRSPDVLVASLLSGYFDCDGGIEKERSVISITSVSNAMIDDLKLLLPRFGCVPIIEKDNTISISGESVSCFNENIGFGLKEKAKKAEILEKKSTGSIVCDTVPCKGLAQIREKEGYSKASIYSPTIRTFRQIVAQLEKMGAAHKIGIDDLAFIEIKDIEEGFEEIVYDFSVPENQNFVAEGIVIHNTTLTDNLVAASGLMSKDLAGKQLVMDFEDQEQARGITINAANISIVQQYDGKEYLINIIDTPGHVDFGGEVLRAMRAVDGVVIVVDAVEGVMPQTETVIRQALREYVKPVLFVNKVDRLFNELQVGEQEMQDRFVRVINQVNNLIKNNPERTR